MERAKKKKLNKIRVITTNIFMGITIVAIAGILTLLAMGYSLSRDGGLEQSGLLQVKSTPSGATVTINGDTQFYRTEMSKMLSGDTHNVLVTKSGYDTWEANVNIETGLLTRIDWVRLFPLEKTIETVHSYDSLRLVSVSPESHYFLLLPNDSPKAQIIDIRSDEVKYKTLDFATALHLEKNTIPIGQLDIIAWNSNNTKFLLKWTHEEIVEWHLIDTQKTESSINLTQAFQLNFTDLQIVDDAATKIWALESGNLRLIHVDTTTISSILVSNIDTIYSNAEAIALIKTNPTTSKRTVELYKEGEKGTTTLHKLPEDATSVIAMGSNWTGDWVAYTVNERFFVLSGKYPSYETAKSAKTFKTIFENDLDFVPTAITPNPTERFAIASADTKISAADIEIGERYYYEFSSNDKINWLDNFLLWSDHDNTLTVIDFNGLNRRSLGDIATGYTLGLTSNNRWLYFISSKTTEATESEPEATTYLLQRERL